MDSTSLAHCVLGITALAKRLQDYAAEAEGDDFATLIHNAAASLTALYSVQLRDVCPQVKQPSLTVLASFFMVGIATACFERNFQISLSQQAIMEVIIAQDKSIEGSLVICKFSYP